MYNKVNALQFEFSGTYKITHAANRKKTLSNDDTNLFPMFLQFCSLTFISLVQINLNWDY